VADGVENGEFRAIDPDLATSCIRTALIRFHHPLLIVQCERIPGPTLEEFVEFVMAGLEPPSAAA
jgi:hypothetical protein